MGRAGKRAPLLGLLLLLIAAALAVQGATWRLTRAVASPQPIAPTVAFSPPAARWLSPEPAVVEAIAALAPEESFRAGQTLSEVLEPYVEDAAARIALIGTLAEFTDLRKLKPTDSYAALLDDAGRLHEFRLTLAGRGRVSVAREAEGWRGAFREFERSTRTRVVAGELHSVLETAVREAGGQPLVAYEMADVLQWDLDFTRDLRRGDRFEVLYEEVYLDGDFDSVGPILALRYASAGRRWEAYRWGDPAGYYDADGRPLRKLFLRSPMRYSRVTSRFSHRRYHPVLKRYRPHYGVDYGAPTGTPVRVTANGTVTFAGWDRGGGRTIKVRHPNGFLTAYLHLSGFASGVRRGRRVSQGDVIGYVGSTGLATGPHLDYRVQRNGRWINPLTMTSEPAPPIPSEELPLFAARRDELQAWLAAGQPVGSEPAQIASLDRGGSATPAAGGG